MTRKLPPAPIHRARIEGTDVLLALTDDTRTVDGEVEVFGLEIATKRAVWVRASSVSREPIRRGAA